MLRQLIQLYWKQTRRNFSWKDVFIAAYFGFLLICMAVGFYIGMDGDVGKALGDLSVDQIAIYIIWGMIPMDTMMKYFVKQEAPIMDDYLRTRPMRQQTWNHFLVFANLVDFWTFAFPVMFLLVLPFFLSWHVVLISVFALYSVSMVDAMMATCYKKSRGWELRLAMLLAVPFFICGSLLYSILTMWMAPWLQLLVYTLLNIGGVGLFYLYLCNVSPYDEHQRKASKVKTLNQVSYFYLDYISLWRAKRLRQTLIFITAIMWLNFYLQLLTEDSRNVWGGFPMEQMYLYYVLGVPSMLLAQWTFSIEANFFHGLWTKPISISHMLQTKFYNSALLCVVMIVLVIPYLCLTPTRWFTVVACIVFITGFQNLISMPTCLYSSRMDLFTSAFFNYQGKSMKFSPYGLITLIPLIIYVGLAALLPATAADLIFFGLGTAGWVAHRYSINWLAQKFIARRHERFESYNQ